MNWLDWVLLAVLVVGALYGMRLGLIGAAFNAVGIYAGWLIAGQVADKVGGVFDSSLGGDTLVTVGTYAVIIALTVVVTGFALKIVRPLLTIFTLGLSSMVDRLGGLVLGLVLGLALFGAVIIGLARLTYNFDPSVPTEAITGALVGQAGKVDDLRTALEGALSGTQLQEQVAHVEELKSALSGSLTESQLASQIAKVDDLRQSVQESLSGIDLDQQLARVDDLRQELEARLSALGLTEQLPKVEDVKQTLEDGLTGSKLVSAFANVVDALPASALGFVPSDFKLALDILEENID